VSELLAAAGVLLAVAAAAATILLPRGRLRVAAMLVAVAFSPILILGDQWHTAQIADLRGDTGRVIALLAIAAGAVAALGALFYRWPRLLPLLIVFALPFRIPLEAGGDTANLLVPLYLVIAGGVIAAALRVRAPNFASTRAGGVVGGDHPPRGGGGPPTATGPARRSAPNWLPIVLATVVVLYALQLLYSEDFSKGLQNVCFFLVPFTVAYGLIRDVEWDRRLLTWVLALVCVEALAFVAVGSVEYATRELFWNDQVIRANDFHTYFRVNSVFWDPNVYGRYLALVIVLATATLLWVRGRRDFALLTVLVAVLWLGLAQTFSQSSYIALLAGLAALAAIRWSWKWTLVAVVAVLLVGSSGFDADTLNKDTSGRSNLISGGIDLFAERPLWGYGSGSFEEAYRVNRENQDAPVSASHTQPVTVLAEQGLIGFAAYLALICVALWTMSTGIRTPPAAGGVVGGDHPPRGGGGPPTATGPAARSAVLAAFVALLVHTMSYAGFFEDPITWVLLAVGASLAAAPAANPPPAARAPASEPATSRV